MKTWHKVALVLTAVGGLFLSGYLTAVWQAGKARSVEEAVRRREGAIVAGKEAAFRIRDSIRTSRQDELQRNMKASLTRSAAREAAARVWGDSLAARLAVAEATADTNAIVAGLKATIAQRDEMLAAKIDSLRGMRDLGTLFTEEKQRSADLQFQIDSVLKPQINTIEGLLDARNPPPPVVPIQKLGSRLAGYGETAALGLATAEACRSSFLSAGCIAGGVALAVKAKPWRVL